MNLLVVCITPDCDNIALELSYSPEQGSEGLGVFDNPELILCDKCKEKK